METDRPTVSTILNILSKYGHTHDAVRGIEAEGRSEEEIQHLLFYLCYYYTRHPDVLLTHKITLLIDQSYTRYLYVRIVMDGFIDSRIDAARREMIDEGSDLLEMSYMNGSSENRLSSNHGFSSVRGVSSDHVLGEGGSRDAGDDHFEIAMDKLARMQYLEVQRSFLSSLFAVSRDLKGVDTENRMEYLELQLFLLNFELNKRRLTDSGLEDKSNEHLRQGIMIGFTQHSESNMVERI